MWLPFSLVRRMTVGSIVFHTARQPPCVVRTAFPIILCPVSAAVGGNDGQVTGDVVFLTAFRGLRVFHGVNITAVVCAVLTQPFLAVLPPSSAEAVMVITGYITGTVGEARQPTVTAPCRGFPPAGGIFRCRVSHRWDYHTSGDIAVRAVSRIRRPTHHIPAQFQL